MYVPYLSPVLSGTARLTEGFGGLCRIHARSDGSLVRGLELSLEGLPTVQPCRPAVLEQTFDSACALWAGEKLLVVDGGSVLYDGRTVGQVTEGPKHMAALGDTLFLFPDKVWVDLNTGAFGSMEAACTAQGLTFAHNSLTLPGDCPFRAGDGVTVSGCSRQENNKTAVVQRTEGSTLYFYDNVFTPGDESGSVTLARRVPDLEQVCAWGGRLWGTVGNTVLGSKYGDGMNFSVFEGLAGDSYAIEADTPGPFTGCAAFTGHACFFKEDAIHKLYGAKPRNFQLVVSRAAGVAAGCRGALCRVGEKLIYPGPGGVWLYGGGLPRLISGDLGPLTFHKALAAAADGKYYLCPRPGEPILVCRVEQETWLERRTLPAVAMAGRGEQVWALCPQGLYRLEAGDVSNARWQAELGPFPDTGSRALTCTCVTLRLDRAPGSALWLFARRGSGPWQPLTLTGSGSLYRAALPPGGAGALSLRLEGRGAVTLYSILRQYLPSGKS